MPTITLVARPEQLPTQGHVLIFGAGEGGRIVYKAFGHRAPQAVLGFIDNAKDGHLLNRPIHRPAAALAAFPAAHIVVASMYAHAIGRQLEVLGVTAWWNAAPLIRTHILARQRYSSLWSALLIEPLWIICAFVQALLARGRSREVDIGVGPTSLINNTYHRKALRHAGYSAESFSFGLSHVTSEFDRIFVPTKAWYSPFLTRLRLCWLALSRYRCLYLYFDGGPFSFTRWAWRAEPLLFALARTRVVVMPYGQDVQAFTRCPNLPFKHATMLDYPHQTRGCRPLAGRIDLWTRHADHVLSGCDWVDYMYHWDTLMLAHFAVDIDRLRLRVVDSRGGEAPAKAACARPATILVHTPNHRYIKGTPAVLAAVRRLRDAGYAIELRLVELAPNQAVLEAMAAGDLIIDQLVIGWYAMVAIEAMALGKPVICHIRPDLLALYQAAGLLEPGELPVIDATPATLTETLRGLLDAPERLPEIGARGAAFVQKHHSVEAIGRTFARINRSLGLAPGCQG